MDRRFFKNALIWCLGICACLYLALCAYFYFNQGSIIFRGSSSRLPAGYQFHFAAAFKEYTIKTPDGNTVSGVLFTTAAPKGLIFYLHGNSGSVLNYMVRHKNIPHSGMIFSSLIIRALVKAAAVSAHSSGCLMQYKQHMTVLRAAIQKRRLSSSGIPWHRDCGLAGLDKPSPKAYFAGTLFPAPRFAGVAPPFFANLPVGIFDSNV